MTARSIVAGCSLVWGALIAPAPEAFAQTVDQLTPHNVKVESVDYQGKRAVRITEDGTVANGEAYAIVKNEVFHNGAISLELAGRPAPGVSEGARGFIG